MGVAEAKNDTENPIGGGDGYSLSVAVPSAMVHTEAELISELSSADGVTPKTVFVGSDIEITRPLELSTHVTLAGDRGRLGLPGPLLRRAFDGKVMVIVNGTDVRITGLRIDGLHSVTDDEDANGKYIVRRVGIRREGDGNLEIDNCELFGWSHAAVFLESVQGAQIHHNFIHHNQMKGYGYGIMLDGATSIIKANIFQYNRHHIAGTGESGTGYEAKFNIFYRRGNKSNSSACDMHGGYDRRDQTAIAGDYIHIEHNDFNVCNSSGGSFNASAAVFIRGLPTDTAVVKNNHMPGYYVGPDDDFVPEKAILQRFSFGSLATYRESLREGDDLLERYRSGSVDSGGNDFGEPDRPAWYVSWGGRSKWYRVLTPPVLESENPNHVAFGHFPKTWHKSGKRTKADMLSVATPSGGPARRHFKCRTFTNDSGRFNEDFWKSFELDCSQISISELLFGDFRDTSLTNVLKVQGDQFHISTDMKRWNYVSPEGFSVGAEVGQLACADVDGDGFEEVLKVVMKQDNTRKCVMWKARKKKYDEQNEYDQQWRDLFEDCSLPPISEIAFADWYGDGIAHALWADGHEWKAHWSTSPTSRTDTLRTWSEPAPAMSEVGVGDFTGDGIADVFRITDDGRWEISARAREDWSCLRCEADDATIGDLHFVDLNGNGITDVLRFK